jgi:hypothetical protein
MLPPNFYSLLYKKKKKNGIKKEGKQKEGKKIREHTPQALCPPLPSLNPS